MTSNITSQKPAPCSQAPSSSSCLFDSLLLISLIHVLWTHGKDYFFKEIILLDHLKIPKFRLSFSPLNTSIRLVLFPFAGKDFAHLLHGLVMNIFSLYYVPLILKCNFAIC